MPTIYYFAYTNPTTGGDFVNIEHVRALQSMGFPARMLHGGNEEAPLLPPQSIPITSAHLQANDWLVIPENDVGVFEWARSTPCKIVIHNQNSFYLFNAVARMGVFDERLFANMICPSHANASVVRQSGYAGSISVISPFLPEYFKPRDKYLKIAYSPRKLPVEAGAVRGIFVSTYPKLSEIPWVEISGLPREEVAEILGSSAIYAAFSNLEAISLSVLEALRSGCIVVGDHGGSYDYAREENGIWVEANDITSFSNGLARAISCFSHRGGDSSYSRAAFESSLQYSEDAFRQALRAYWLACL